MKRFFVGIEVDALTPTGAAQAAEEALLGYLDTTEKHPFFFNDDHLTVVKVGA